MAWYSYRKGVGREKVNEEKELIPDSNIMNIFDAVILTELVRYLTLARTFLKDLKS